MLNSFKSFTKIYEDRIKPQLNYYAFDWDDNILFMDTIIHMEEKVGDDWVPKNVSTLKFSKIRKEENWRVLNNDDDRAFSEFRDFGPRGDRAFFEDVITSIRKKKFGPSWDDFIEALTGGSIFAIVTARGHEPDSIKKPVKWIIYNVLTKEQKNEMASNLIGYSSSFDSFDPLEEKSFEDLVDDYLSVCDFYGITSKFFSNIYPGSSANPEEAKKSALRLFAKKAKDFGEKLDANVHLGFSDDDAGNVEAITKLFKNEISLNSTLNYHVFDTSKQNIKKVHLEGNTEPFGIGSNGILKFKDLFNINKERSMSNDWETELNKDQQEEIHDMTDETFDREDDEGGYDEEFLEDPDSELNITVNKRDSRVDYNYHKVLNYRAYHK